MQHNCEVNQTESFYVMTIAICYYLPVKAIKYVLKKRPVYYKKTNKKVRSQGECPVRFNTQCK